MPTRRVKMHMNVGAASVDITIEIEGAADSEVIEQYQKALLHQGPLPRPDSGWSDKVETVNED